MFGRLHVVAFSHIGNQRTAYWYCLCSCGVYVTVRGSNLHNGHTQSCGCLRKERCSKKISEIMTKHGFTKTVPTSKLYGVWRSMKQRCYKSQSKGFKNYGGRGITICDEWANNPKSFIDWALLNGWQKGLQIDRIDNDGNYAPSNCRFVTPKENNNNKSRRI